MARVGRKRRLPVSRSSGAIPIWQPSDDDWIKIESVYGIVFDESMRAETAVIVATYFENEPFGRNAPVIDLASGWLEDMREASLNFLAAYSGGGGGGAKVYAEGLVNEHIRLIGSNADFRLRDLVRVMTDVAVAARSSADEIKSDDHPEFEEKVAWRAMIKHLHAFAGKHGLSTAINKSGMIKKAASDVSPFVSFVHEIQSSFPEGVTRWHATSYQSLATNIRWAIA